MARPLVSLIPRLAEIIAAFPSRTNEELAAEFGLTRRQCANIGSTHGLRKTHEVLSRARRTRKTPIEGAPWTTLILKAIHAAGKTGIDFPQARRAAPSANEDQVRAALNKLTAEGRIHRYAKHRSSRWFSTAEMATVHGARLLTPTPAAAENGVRIAQGQAPAQLRGEPRITDRTVITPCPGVPGPEARWHGNARPVFSGLRPGQYADAPSSWVSAVTTKL